MKSPKYTTILMDKKWIDENITKTKWQRDLYSARVNRFILYIKNNNFHQSLITICKFKKKMVLLDGQHKLEAIKRTNKRFLMDVCYYEDLTEEEMKSIYVMLNDIKVPRLVDDIKLLIGVNKTLDYFLNIEQFPINITLNGGKNSLGISNFLNILWNGLRPLPTRSNLSRGKLQSFLRDLSKEDNDMITNYFRTYREIFGEPQSGSWVYRNTLVFTIMRIWIKNKDKFTQEDFIKILRPIESNLVIRQTSGRNDSYGIKELTNQVYDFINKKRTTNRFDLYYQP